MQRSDAGIQVLRGNVVLPDRVLEGGLVVVEGGVIQAVAENGAYAPTLDLGTHLISPGFIDLHTHGIAGADTMDATPEALLRMACRYAAHGVTAFLATTMTHSLGATLAAVESVRAHMERPADPDTPAAQALGLHLEGPWISHQYKGAQNGLYIVPPDDAVLKRLLAAASGAIRKVTLAPELPGAEGVVRRLRREGIYVSLGHTAVTYEGALQAVEWGATHVTHCFNAMTGLHHRRPGLVGAALLHDGLYAELIADGVHVHPDVMRLLVRAKGRERVMLITDSMAAMELQDGTYALGGQKVLVQGGQARLADGTLAGSTLTFDAAVRNMVRLCGIPLLDALYMAAATPADAIGLGNRKGRIAAGYDADLAVLDADLRAELVMIAGRVLPAGVRGT